MRYSSLLRVLLPSWRFFDDSSSGPRLFFRTRGAAGDAFGEWRELDPRPARRARGLGALVLNPRGNLALAHHTLLEHLLDDLASLDPAHIDAVESLVSYRLVQRLVRSHGLDAHGLHAGVSAFQFKLRLESDEAEAPSLDVLISSVHAA